VKHIPIIQYGEWMINDGQRVVGEIKVYEDGHIYGTISNREIVAAIQELPSGAFVLTAEPAVPKTAEPIPQMVTSADVEADGGYFSKEDLESICRNARAYAWEVGHGQEMTPRLSTTPGNPFLDPEWRNHIKDYEMCEACQQEGQCSYHRERGMNA
jgi:hypothetical protein